MNYGLHELWTSTLALVTLPLFFFAPGYVTASLTNVFDFQSRGAIERLLWAVALSQPVSLLLAVHPGVPIAPRWTTAVFVGAAVYAAALLWRDQRLHPLMEKRPWQRGTAVGITVAIFLVLFCVLSAVPIETRGRLYESAVWQDWNVRIQLVNAAIRGGNAPGNPMFAPGGVSAPLHYYYYWYVLCARMHDLVPVSARAVFTTSCAGASLSVLAFLLLAVKYLTALRHGLRQTCMAMLLGSAIIGLDLVPSAFALWHHRAYPNLQFWLSDRSPSWLHILLWSPHHGAGVECCGLAILLFVHSLDLARRQRITHAILAGICFAAAIGTSTFIALLFASASAFLFLDAALRKQWAMVRVILGAGALAFFLDASFLHHVLLAPSPAQAGGSHGRALTVWPRYAHQALELIWFGLRLLYREVLHRSIIVPTPGSFIWTQRLLRPFAAAFLFLLDFGFFAFVLIYQARVDLFVTRPMTRQERVLWLVFAGIAIPGCILNSAVMQNNNDLGRHAGLCMHFVMLLWAAPLIAEYLAQASGARARGVKRSTVFGWPRFAERLAVACALLGIAGQITQVILDRVRVPLTDAGLLPRVVVAERVPHIGLRFGEIERGMAEAARLTPTDSIVQGNPHSRFQPVFLLYASRQMAASDDGCNTPFGGDPAACAPLVNTLVRLFGGEGPHFQGASRLIQPPITFDPAFVTPASFSQVCASAKLGAVVANYSDPVWHDRSSWVWQLRPAYANSTVRVFTCPQSARPSTERRP